MDITKRSEGLRKGWIIFLFFLMEAEVFQKSYFAILEGTDHIGSLRLLEVPLQRAPGHA